MSLQPISQDTYYEPLLHCSVTSHNCNREYPCHSAKFCWSSLTRLAESLLPPSRIYRSLFRGPGVRKLAACRFLPAPVLLHTDVLIFNFQAAIPLRDIIIITQNVSSVKESKRDYRTRRCINTGICFDTANIDTCNAFKQDRAVRSAGII